jgi:uncharacterized lipoprotein YddW (UPF0748 family)
MKSIATALLLLFLLLPVALAQTPDPPKYEFRSAWVATVPGLDWPAAGQTAAQQESSLRSLIRNMKAKGMNAVVFQASPRGDAYYQSERLPWAARLTGTLGQDPGWDPLQVAIEEAHSLGMEFHAWYNFGRIGDINASLQDTDEPRHVYFSNPEWTVTLGETLLWLNPGHPEAREWAIQNVMEIVRNYDVDAVHFDFVRYGATAYPGDSALRDEHDSGMNLSSWRRENVNRFTMVVHDSVKAVKPWVKVGSTPIGHYKTSGGWGHAPGYSQYYSDSRRWLMEKRHDYLAPQLYWGIGSKDDAPQFEWLVNDWMSEAYDRHIYVGTAPYKSFVYAELPAQIDTTRAHDAHGQVHFRYANIASGTPFADRYAHPAIVPPMEWLDMTEPPTPISFGYEWDDDIVTLKWSPADADDARNGRHFYAVYRIGSTTEPDYATALEDPRNLLAVTGDTLLTDSPAIADHSYYYVVRSMSRNYVESDPSGAIVLEGRAVGTETTDPVAFGLGQNYPNPFSSRTTITFELDAPGEVTIRVYNLLGQEVATLVDRELHMAGTGTVEWNGTAMGGESLASGTYFYTIEAAGNRATRSMTLVR